MIEYLSFGDDGPIQLCKLGAEMNKTSDDLGSLEQTLCDRGGKYLLASYVDMHGVSQGKVVPIASLRQMMAGSELCTGAALDGVPQDVNGEEVAAHPDPASCTVQPWQPDVAWFASDLWYEGKPFEPCSRTILKRVLAKGRSMGFDLNCGMEAGFFVLRDAEGAGYVPVGTRATLAKPAYAVARGLATVACV